MAARRWVVVAVALGLGTGVSWADETPFVAEGLTQQGRLLDASDQPINGTVDLTFTLYHDPTGGTPAWTEDFPSVQVANGYYAVRLGDPSAGAQAITTDDLAGPTYLDIAIDHAELSPRLQFGSVPYAQRADLANRIEGGTIDGATITNSSVDATSVSVGGQTVIDSSGNVDASSLTVGGKTVVDANGNLATLQSQLAGAGMVAADANDLGGKPASDYVTTDELQQGYSTSNALASQEYDNRVRNGSFEIGAAGSLPADWEAVGAGTGTRAQKADAQAPFGANVLEIANNGQSGQVAVRQVIIPAGAIVAAAGDTLTASVFAKKVSGPQGRPGRLCLTESDDDPAPTCIALTMDNGYARATVSHPVSATATYLAVLLDPGTAAGDTNTYDFDGVMITRGTLAPPFGANVAEQVPSELPDASITPSKLVMGPGSGLDADTLDGIDSTGFVRGNYVAGNASGDVPVSNGTVNTDLNADLVDGQTASAIVAAAKAAIPNPSSYIQNGTSTQASASFDIDGAGTIGGTLTTSNLVATGNVALDRPSAMVDGGPTVGGLFNVAPAQFPAANGSSSYFKIYFPDDNSVRLASDFDGHLAASSFRDIQIGTVNNPFLDVQAATGDVGIGTTNPGAKVDIRGTPTGSGAVLEVVDTQASQTTTSFGGIYVGSGPGTDFVLGKYTHSNGTSSDERAFQLRDSAGNVLIDAEPVSGGNGDVGIGTATPGATLDVNGSIGSAGLEDQRDIFTWSTTDSGSTPLHLKTSWGFNGAMYRFVVHGYNYGEGLPIYSDCVGYMYETDQALVSASCHDYAGGISLGQYVSSDGKLVLKLAVTTSYFMGFGVDVEQYNPEGVKPVTITAYRQSANL